MADSLHVVGKRLPKLDALPKATGEIEYLADLKFPGMLQGAILRSPYPHARIVSIDTHAAERLPGVRSVITSKDTPEKKFSFVEYLADKLIMAKDKVRYIGDEVAGVAAVDEETAQEAARLIRVEYEELPAVYEVDDAMKPDAPLIHEDKGSNVAFEIHRKFGDPDRGFAESDEVFEDRFETQRVAHAPMETRGCVARFDRSGRLTVWAPSQAPHTQRNEIAKSLRIAPARVRLCKLPTGGAFGNRLVMDMACPIAAILSAKTSQAVKIVNTRQEEFETSKTRYRYLIDMKTGVKKDGRIHARAARVIADNGAYNDKAPATLSFSGSMFCLIYDVEHLQYDGYAVYTNRQYGTGFRGFGNPQVTFAHEHQADLIAQRLGMDPLEFRRKNANQPGKTRAVGANLKVMDMTECLDRAATALGWEEKRKAYEQRDLGKPWRGIGIATMVHTAGGNRFYGYNAASSVVKVSEDGLVTLVTPACDVGQGAQTIVAQICAEELGVTLDDVVVITDDTDLTPYDLGSWGSRVTWVVGQAAQVAARNARQQIFEAVATELEVSPDDLVSKEGWIGVRGAPDKGMPFPSAVDLSFKKRGRPIQAEGKFVDEVAPESMDWDTQSPNFASAAHAVEVEVDPDTGKVRVLDFKAAHGIGLAINPMAAEGQIEGSVSQGVGFGLMEELIMDGGKAVNPNFADYKIPSFLDLPRVDAILVENADPDGPFGAAGIGEPGLVPTAAAVANAVAHATGCHFRTLPVTAEKILQALKEKRTEPG